MPKVEWALHRMPQNPDNYELGFRNLTKDEAGKMLLTLAEIQRSRGEAIDPAVVANAREIDLD
jgi:hypothetical protein